MASASGLRATRKNASLYSRAPIWWTDRVVGQAGTSSNAVAFRPILIVDIPPGGIHRRAADERRGAQETVDSGESDRRTGGRRAANGRGGPVLLGRAPPDRGRPVGTG